MAWIHKNVRAQRDLHVMEVAERRLETKSGPKKENMKRGLDDV